MRFQELLITFFVFSETKMILLIMAGDTRRKEEDDLFVKFVYPSTMMKGYL